MEASEICTMNTPSAKRLQQSIQVSAAHSYFDSDRLMHSQTEKISNICKIRRQDEDCYNFTDIANISLQCSPSSTGYQGQEMSRNKCFHLLTRLCVLVGYCTKRCCKSPFSASSLAD
jgi:hypothetical protein